jgi:hypothetical protein
MNLTPDNSKRLSPAEEEEELREIRSLFWKYIANPKYRPDPDAESTVWTKLKSLTDH